MHFAEFLNAGSLVALEYSSRLPVSVCGTVPDSLTLEIISWRLDYTHFTSLVAPYRFNGSPQGADLPTPLTSSPLRPGKPSPSCASPHASSLRNYQGYGNMNPFPIDYALQPRLRGRLTLGRLTLPRKPQASGEWGSHPSFRYSCQHTLF